MASAAQCPRPVRPCIPGAVAPPRRTSGKAGERDPSGISHHKFCLVGVVCSVSGFSPSTRVRRSTHMRKYAQNGSPGLPQYSVRPRSPWHRDKWLECARRKYDKKEQQHHHNHGEHDCELRPSRGYVVMHRTPHNAPPGSPGRQCFQTPTLSSLRRDLLILHEIVAPAVRRIKAPLQHGSESREARYIWK